MPRFQDIPQFTRHAGYAVDVGWDYLPTHFAHAVQEYRLDINPDFQRGYVWTLEQKVRYVEYVLQGGQSGRDLYTNNPCWNKSGTPGDKNWWYVLVDGKQRLNAVLGFLSNEFPIFGVSYYRDYTDRLSIVRTSFRWHVNDLATYPEVLQWYVDLNRGGTIHTDQEIERVWALKQAGTTYRQPTLEELCAQAELDREIVRIAIVEEVQYQAKMDEKRAQAAVERTSTKKRGRRR
jgi:hypothetical protein